MYADRQAQLPSMVKVARRMMEARNPPTPQHIDTQAVRYPWLQLVSFLQDRIYSIVLTRMLGGTISAA